MKWLVGTASVLVTTFVMMPGIVVAQEAKNSVAKLSWLGGCWEMTSAAKGLTITEMWMKPAGGLMIGSGRTVSGDKAIDFEFLRIVEDPDGIFYVARPSDNRETRFKLMRGTSNEAVFENPAHDFPQRVIYKRDGDKLNARIEGTKDGKTRGIDFPYARITCN